MNSPKTNFPDWEAVHSELGYEKTDGRSELRGRLDKVRDLLSSAPEAPERIAKYGFLPAPPIDRREIMMGGSEDFQRKFAEEAAFAIDAHGNWKRSDFDNNHAVDEILGAIRKATGYIPTEYLAGWVQIPAYSFSELKHASSAAPDLLAALEKCESLLSNLDPSSLGSLEIAARKQARAAIARAKGQA